MVTNLQTLQSLLTYKAVTYYLKLANTNYVNMDLLQNFCSSGTDKEVERIFNELRDTDTSNMFIHSFILYLHSIDPVKATVTCGYRNRHTWFLGLNLTLKKEYIYVSYNREGTRVN